MHPTSYGDSPYQSISVMAGNPYFIDLELLAKDGLLEVSELRENLDTGHRIDYGRLFESRFSLLRRAHRRFVPKRAYARFLRAHEPWLFPYALFMALKVHYGYAPWTAWDERHRCFSSASTEADRFADEISFWYFTQYCFFTQWLSLRAYAKAAGISIIGDMPIYVAHDSVEVWESPELFLLDDVGRATEVAGCPPDAFSPDGQRWGNPLYRWDAMEKDGFRWWLRRLGHAFSLYDVLRIDHFRAFAGYYAIPANAPDATGGEWRCVPGVALFDAVRERFPRARVIAEDLGLITPDVRALLAHTAFPGMKVLQFAFDTEESEYLPRNFEGERCVAYTASHDNSCTASWLGRLSPEARRRLWRECPHTKGQSRVYDLIELALRSPATLAIIPMQDYLCLTDELGRLNTPSTAQGNWTWRLSPRYNTAALRRKILSLTEKTGRK